MEDEPLVRTFLAGQLKGLGYKVHDVEDGPAALAYLDRARHIDLLLTDMMMPGGLSGVEIAAEAKRRKPGIRVIYSTGYPHDSRMGFSKGCFEAGENGPPMLKKPYRRETLAQTIRDALHAPPDLV